MTYAHTVNTPDPQRPRARPPWLRVQTVQLVCEGSSPFVRRKVSSAADVYEAFRETCAAADRESFFSVLLDTKH